MKAITKTTFLFVMLLSLSLAASCQLTNFYSTTTPLPTFTTQVINSETPEFTVTTPAIAGDLGWGTIHGKVTDAITGVPIVKAKITCDHFSYTSTARCQGDTFTDIDGNYFFTNIFFHDTDKIQLRLDGLSYEPKAFILSFFRFPEFI